MSWISNHVPSPAPLRHENGGTYLTATRYWCTFSAFEMFANILTFAACVPEASVFSPWPFAARIWFNTIYIKAYENLPKFLGETQRTRYTEAGTYLYQLAVCHVHYQRQWVCAVLRTRFFGIFWTINKRVVTRAVVCCSVFSLPLRKGAKRDCQPWSCLSLRLHWKSLHPL